ncbi:MAG: hypothetical protein OEZ57_15525 [Nitrospirota bacterium]|nr:hypothetical protein [Nitrospirota bacterium]
MPVSLLFMVVKSFIWSVGHRGVILSPACSPANQGEQVKCQHSFYDTNESLMAVTAN